MRSGFPKCRKVIKKIAPTFFLSVDAISMVRNRFYKGIDQTPMPPPSSSVASSASFLGATRSNDAVCMASEIFLLGRKITFIPLIIETLYSSATSAPLELMEARKVPRSPSWTISPFCRRSMVSSSRLPERPSRRRASQWLNGWFFRRFLQVMNIHVPGQLRNTWRVLPCRQDFFSVRLSK